MADYYPLLSKAITGLEPNTADARQGIYERARSALTRQLASMDPPVAQDILDRELNALEAVFVRIEADQRATRDQDLASALPNYGVADLEPTVPVQSRPQVVPIKPKQNRKPLIAVGLSLGVIAVIAIATLAFLRRNEPAAVANRPAQSVPTIVAERPSTPAKTNDRVLPSGVTPSGVTPSGGDVPAQTPVAQRPAVPTPAVPTPVAQAPVPSTPAVVAPPQAPTPPPRVATPTSPPANIPAGPSAVPLNTAPPPVASAAPAIAVANKALMILEGKEQPSAIEQRLGTVVWRTEMVSGGQGQPLQQAIKASVDIPEVRSRAEIIIQRNRDAAFPASHTVQVQFSSVGASELGAVQSLSLLELRQTENQGGYPVAGQGIAVMENVFLIALSKVEPALSRNIEMMLSRPILYFEFQFVGGRRGAMIIDKGISGQQAFDDAFRNWQ
jgi:hypothetical protein